MVACPPNKHLCVACEQLELTTFYGINCLFILVRGAPLLQIIMHHLMQHFDSVPKCLHKSFRGMTGVKLYPKTPNKGVHSGNAYTGLRRRTSRARNTYWSVVLRGSLRASHFWNSGGRRFVGRPQQCVGQDVLFHLAFHGCCAWM